MKTLENIGCFIVFAFMMYLIFGMMIGFPKSKKKTGFNYAEFDAARQTTEKTYNKSNVIEYVNSFDKEAKSKKK